MPEPDDISLLRQYTEDDSEVAFAALVERHINKIYSVALRHTRNPHQAEEITQAVFVILAKKACGLGKHVILSGWLYQTARLTSVTFLRSEIRRTRREQEAHMQNTLEETAFDETWKQIGPLLDTAMARLNDVDRNAVVLRFFDGKSMSEVGAALGASEEAAKKRVNRALEKLRKFFTKRGVVSTTAIIGAVISANSVQAAPAALAKSVTAVALAKGAAASVSILTLVKGALKVMAWTKAQTAIVTGAVVLLVAAGTTTVTVKEIHEYQNDEWQLGKIDVSYLDKRPYRTVILPTKSAQRRQYGTGGSAFMGDGRSYGIDVSVEGMLRWAFAQPQPDGFYYSLFSPVRTVLATRVPSEQYDFFSNLPKGSEEALQLEIKKKFGLTAEYQTIETNVLVLEVKYPNSAGLKPSTHKDASSNYGNGNIQANNKTMEDLAKELERRLGIPVINQTGLTNSYDFRIQWQDKPVKTDANGVPLNPDDNPNLNELKQALNDQLGLELIPDTAPIEMLVVEKAN